MDVFLPGQEPVGREGQLALEGDLPAISLVQADQALIRQRGFRLQHLHAGAHLMSMAARSICLIHSARFGDGALGGGGLAGWRNGGFRRANGEAGATASEHFRHAAGHQDVGVQVLVARCPPSAVWLVNKLHTRLSSTREAAQQRVARGQLDHLALDSEARMSADSSFMPRRNTASALSWRNQVLGQHQVR